MESDFERMILLTQYLVLFTFLGALAALLFAVFQAKKVLKFSRGNDLMKKISDSIKKGANAYLKRQYMIVGVFFVVMFVVLLVMAICGLTAAKFKIRWLTDYALPLSLIIGMASAIPFTAWLG